MPIVGRQTWSNDAPPLRGYVYLPKGVHVSNFDANSGLSCLVGCADRLRRDKFFEDYQFVLAFVSGNLCTMTSRGKIFTFFGYESNPQDKKRNPDPFIDVFQVEGSKHCCDPRVYDDMLQVVAEEAKYRKRTKNFHQYISSPPKIKGLELVVDKMSDLPPA